MFNIAGIKHKLNIISKSFYPLPDSLTDSIGWHKIKLVSRSSGHQASYLDLEEDRKQFYNLMNSFSYLPVVDRMIGVARMALAILEYISIPKDRNNPYMPQNTSLFTKDNANCCISQFIRGLVEFSCGASVKTTLLIADVAATLIRHYPLQK